MRGRLVNQLKARARHQLPLQCSLCIFTVDEDTVVKDAITIINGQAVCFDHIYLVRDNQFMQRIEFAKGERVR